MTRAAVLLLAGTMWTFGISGVRAATIDPGIYRDAAGAKIYVGIEHTPPDAAYAQYLNPKTGATGALSAFKQVTAICRVREERRVVRAPEGPLGVSLFYAGDAPRATVLLIHGADNETRDMGWIVPYFACNGVDVISYDQRGTGASTGSWLADGPQARARDADALYDVFRSDARVDPRRIGVWAFSNGGWTAPIVAVDRPIAFMILQSAPAESVERNVYYEVRETMLHAGRNDADVDRAIAAWQTIVAAFEGRTPVNAAKEAYVQAKRAPWFEDSLLPLIPERTAFTEPALDGWRRYLSYDPLPTLSKVRTPTLALYGRLDRKVDVEHDVAVLKTAFERAGMRDLTVRWFPDAGHTLKITANGFDYETPARYSRGYPRVMLEWLRARGFVPAGAGAGSDPSLRSGHWGGTIW
ncbi:MAG TPA: alpha/beta hydrolase [Candidatus Acidoferrales bacterium]|nr:alpha/beta hydrolase [Candidatus Acidoferrales bacterium]